MNKVINHIGLSSGKDSTVLLGWAIHESGYGRETIRASFCDTGNEYDEVYEQIELLSRYCVEHGVSPVVTLLPKHQFLELAKKKGRFPGPRSRFCTEHLKMIPTRQHVEYYWLEGYEVLCHSGVRRAESDERANLPERDFDGYLQCPVYRPLLDWSIQDVWAAHQKWGLPINKLYLSGRRRVGCRLCCMSNKEDVRLTVKTRPWVIDLYREWEKRIANANNFSGFFPRNTVPLAQRTKEITTKEGEKMMVCTIDDVARWSQTLRGGNQGGFDFMFEEDDDFDGGLSCRSAMGHCE